MLNGFFLSNQITFDSLTCFVHLKKTVVSELHIYYSNSHIYKSFKLTQERSMLICKWVCYLFSQWTSSEKIELLTKLLFTTSLSERKKIYQIVKSIVPETAIDFTRILPRIVSTYIFSFLDPRSLCRAAQSNIFQMPKINTRLTNNIIIGIAGANA
ncbi:F-box only protein [Echinococcus granulosus]|uniref:F-box only protein n=1 Tax=Echinococcus granulosus TaxID=6210 RepID=W6UPV7_ECHGR|nr:F-box only protein [Echinococcus granulosus]EUB63283.1 F-box only protein [Echinococcus granulosus]